MDSITIQEAQEQLSQLIDDIVEHHKPVIISGQDNNNAVIISQEDWNAIQETLYLVNVPGMKESIQKAAAEPIEECIVLEDLDW